MNLVYHDKAQVTKDARDGIVPVQQHGLERLRCDLQDARGMLEHLCLVRLGDVTVPVPHGYVALGTKVLKTQELVVYQRLERANVDAAHRGRRVFPELCQDGEERSLRLARRSGSREQYVLVGVEDGVCGGNLHGSQTLPVVVVDEVLDERRVAVESVHGGLDVELGKLVLRGWDLSASWAGKRCRILLHRRLNRRRELLAAKQLLNRNAGVL